MGAHAGVLAVRARRTSQLDGKQAGALERALDAALIGELIGALIAGRVGGA